MTSPGGVEVGRVSVRVVPDTSKFLKQAKKELKEISKQLKVQVDVELNSEKLKAELEEIKKRADGLKAKMGVEVDGDGVTREVRRIKQIAQKLVGAIKVTVGLNLPGSIAQLKADLAIIKASVKGYEIKIPIEFVGLAKWLGILGSVAGILLTLPHLIGAIGGAVMVVAGAFALLPALVAGAAFGIGALAVGMKGFFSALGQSGDAAKFEEALKQLTPSAQSAARALAEFREPLSEIRKAVQESLFKGMAKPFADLKKLLPPIKQGLVGAAGGIREMAKSWIQMATSQKSIGDTKTIAGNVTEMFNAMKPAAANFGQAMRDITVVGSTFLPKLGAAVANVTGDFARWAQSARESGRLEEIIQNAIDKIKQLGRVVADVVVGLRNIFKGMSGGQDFLDIVESITQGFRDWSEAKDTQATLKNLGDILRTVATAAVELFQTIFKSGGAILKDFMPFLMTLVRGIGAFLVGAIKAVTPPLQAMARWFSRNREILVPLLLTLATVVTTFKLLATAANGVVQLKKSIDTMKAASSIIGTFVEGFTTNLKKMITAAVQTTGKWYAETGRWMQRWATVAADATKNAVKTSATWIAESAKSAAQATKSFVTMALTASANFIKMAASATLNAIKTSAVWIAQLVVMVATTIAQMAVMVAAWVANWVRMAAVAMAQAIRIGIAWLIALGPIAIIAAAVIALVALIILNWDNIVAFLTMVWNWIKDLAVTVWTAISDFFVWLWDTVSGAFVTAWNAVVDYLAGIWQDITSQIHSAWDAISGFFSNLFQTIGTALKNAIGAVIDFAKGIPGAIWDGLKAAGNALVDAGKWIIKGLVNGLKAAAGAVWDFISGVCEDVWNGIKDFFGIGSPSRQMMKIGKWINEGWAIGLRSNASDVSTQAQKVSQGIYDAFAPVANIGSQWADSVTAATPAALASVDKLIAAASQQATTKWVGELTADEMEPMEDRILTALATGLTVELDGKNVTQSVNKNNLRNQRRR